MGEEPPKAKTSDSSADDFWKAFNFDKWKEDFFRNTYYANYYGIAYDPGPRPDPPRRDSGPTHCPGCLHRDNYHVAGQCYACGNCGWSVVGPGNSYGLPPGWFRTDKCFHGLDYAHCFQYTKPK